MPWFGWWVVALIGGAIGYEVYVLNAWPPSPTVNQGIIAGIQQQNPSVDVNRLGTWLAQAPGWYASTTTKPTVTGYMDWVAVNTPAWAGGQPVTSSPLYNATYANM